jgi:hypothetical protein
MLTQGGQLAASIYANMQLHRIQQMLGGLLVLGTGTLVVSAVGLGISAAGFGLVLSRLGSIEQRLGAFANSARLAQLTGERVEMRQMAHVAAEAQSLLARAEGARYRSDAVSVWRDVEGPLDRAQRYWRVLVDAGPRRSIFCDARFSPEEAASAYEAAVSLASARQSALMLIGEGVEALNYAEEVARWHDAAFCEVRPPDIAACWAERESSSGARRPEDVRAEVMGRCCELVAGVREAGLALWSRPSLLRCLAERGVGGRQYLEALRGCQDVPLVVVAAAVAGT